MTREQTSQLIARVVGCAPIAVGLAVLVGWQFDVTLLKSLSPNFVTMKANTAVCFVLSGILLVLATFDGHHRTRIAAAVLLTSIGCATLAQYVLGVDLGIDQLLYRDRSSALTPHAGRMSPSSAFNFAIVGFAFLFADSKERVLRNFSQGVGIIVFVVGYLAIMGYLYNVDALYRTALYTSVAVHTATLFTLLGIGMLATRPMQGFMRFAMSDDAGGVLIRRLLPVALLLPPLVDWLQLQSPGEGLDVAVAAMANIAIFVALIAWTAHSVRVAEIAKRAAEATAQAGEERLRIALQAAVGGAWDWDLQSGIAWWSPEMYLLWGVPPETVMRLDNSLRQVHEADRENVARTVDAAIASHAPYYCEFRLLDRTGNERWMVSRGRVVLNPIGQPTRLVGITLDISSQKRTERELRLLNLALERSNVELRRFAHVASHDLQTPMRSVASFAELLQTRYARQLDGQGNDWIARIASSVRQLHAIVRDLLHYSRLDSPAQSFTTVSMRDLFDRVVALLEPAIRESGAQVTAADLPVLQADASQVTELLLNLISNAIKYCGAEPPRIHLAARPIDSGWEFALNDNGIGIEPRHHERIFETFQRLHNQQQYPGTGIGLAICRRVVQSHGGKIWVESDIGLGSTFRFTLAPDNVRSK